VVRRTGSKADHEQGGIDLENEALHERLYQSQERWNERSVSRGQLVATVVGLLLTVIAMLGTVAGYLIGDRAAVAKDLTLLQERQSVVRMTLAEDRGVVAGRLDAMQNQLSNLVVELAKHESAQSTSDRERRTK
jgi:hypothetical protein